jgi:hypothetical protein
MHTLHKKRGILYNNFLGNGYSLYVVSVLQGGDVLNHITCMAYRY